MNIWGSGSIAAGEYNEKISISGSGRINGNIRCTELVCSGSVRGVGNVECTEKIGISGSANFEKSVIAQNISVSGSVKVAGDINAGDSIKISGSIKCGGSIKCSVLSCSGMAEIGGEAEAEEIRVSGKMSCAGLLNAEKITINIDGSNTTSNIGSIGGGEIKIINDRKVTGIVRLPLLSKLVNRVGVVTVDELIEGDIVAIESVIVPKVVGRVVAIGANCEIDLVQYSEKIEIDPDAKVKEFEKI